MGPKKEVKNVPVKRENGVKETIPSLDDPINTDSWKCAVVMAVERSIKDSFLLKEFEEEAATQSRPKIQFISYNGIVKIINDFVRGEVRHKYAFFLNFSSVFQEAGEYLTNKSEIPLEILMKIIKAVLLYLKEENLMKIENEARGSIDPIKAMADRPTTLGYVDNKRRDSVKKGDAGLKVRPPSLTKQETDLLKRGEGVKGNHCINDAPINGYFKLYVLLIEFYSPELPLELIKANIPFHGLICLDTSSAAKQPESSSYTRFKTVNRSYDFRADCILKFWEGLVGYIWDPEICYNFRNTIFQVYTPRKLLCGKKERREFIYRELSYLMYDISCYKQQLDHYLENIQFLDVEEKSFDMAGNKLVIEGMPNECVTVPVILQSMMDVICENDLPPSSDTSYSDYYGSFNIAGESDHNKQISPSLINTYGSCLIKVDFSQELLLRGDTHLMDIYAKAKALDVYYNLAEMAMFGKPNISSTGSSKSLCNYKPINCGRNLQEILCVSDSIFRSIRRQYPVNVDAPEVDYILYSILMTRVNCPYQVNFPKPMTSQISLETNSDFKLIENTATEMSKPQFTVTDGSRHVLRSIPYNVKRMSKDFFSPTGLKIISPARLKASSEPCFRVVTPIKAVRAIMSDVYPASEELPVGKDLFLDLEFKNEDVIASTNDFNYLELLNKYKITEKETEFQSMYNCTDHIYSLVHDEIFVAMHNRTDQQNSQYETFNAILRTDVGLRDFYEYILEDEAEWFRMQGQALSLKSSGRKCSQTNKLSFTDSDFWLLGSIKYHFWKGGTMNSEKSEGDTVNQCCLDKIKKELQEEEKEKEKVYAFEGYNVGDTIVQFSGMKTIFYSKDCNVTAELIERLYGEQILGVHISQAGHILHLYSYACPKPHITEPFTFHLTYRNGIIIAFGRRLTEKVDEIKETIESKTTIKSKRNSSDASTRSATRKTAKMVVDEGFHFDMSASLPNGLTIQTVGGMKPCYIRQRLLSHPDEASRLFLPNGNVIKIMTNGTVEIFKTDTSCIKANLNEFANNCSKYEIVKGNGFACVMENGLMTSSKRYQVFQNNDVDNNRVYYRRRDGTNYLLLDDGTICMQFSDNTKLCVSPFAEEFFDITCEEDEIYNPKETGMNEAQLEVDYVIVHLEITTEHPDYVTTIYNTKNQKWRLLLPYDSDITIHPDGEYNVNIDKQTEMVVQNKCIEASRFSTEEQLQFQAVVDLSVFDCGNGVYVSAKGRTGKKFTVEANANCYTETVTEPEEDELSSSLSDNQSTRTPSLCSQGKLTPEKKYFVIRKDMSGFELLHENNVKDVLKDLKNGRVVFTQTFPNSDLRCFVLITPECVKPNRKWEVKSILPDPKYVPNSNKKISSTTYGNPPSWMHPFPKRKRKFKIPECFSCRVFLETKPTGLTPGPNALDCSFCEVEEITPKHTLINRTRMKDYLWKLSNDDQDILREMYTIIAGSVINKTKKVNLTPSEELTHYLKMSQYYVELQEYHKKCIRYHIVPNYFHHPAGMSWLILNSLIDRIKISEDDVNICKGVRLEKTPLSALAKSSHSVSDVEYNLSVRTFQSFSDLSYHSSKSGHTAPGIIETEGVDKCKVRAVRNTVSTPAIDYNWREKQGMQIESDSDRETEFPPRVCDFSDSDIDLFDAMSYRGCERVSKMTLEDLMCLGLV